MSDTTYLPSEEFVKNAAIAGMPAYEALCKEAADDYEGYWGRLAKELITWQTRSPKCWTSPTRRFFKWFADGKLNASYNCLDRNVERGLGDKTAIIFEADGGEVTKVTYSELLAKVSQMANGLKALGVGKGDRVVIYIAMSVDGVAAMQACARIGATHSVVFGGFSAQSLRDRIEDTGAKAGHHRRLPSARRQEAAPEVHRGRSPGAGRLRKDRKGAGGQPRRCSCHHGRRP